MPSKAREELQAVVRFVRAAFQDGVKVGVTTRVGQRGTSRPPPLPDPMMVAAAALGRARLQSNRQFRIRLEIVGS